jgi:hypothetical protein
MNVSLRENIFHQYRQLVELPVIISHTWLEKSRCFPHLTAFDLCCHCSGACARRSKNYFPGDESQG